MRLLALALPIATALAVLNEASAQPFCANFSDGRRSCGIPTFQSCLETVRGVGGSCGPDMTSQIPPNLIQRRRMMRRDAGPPRDRQPGSDWMPPPPGM